jgi:hypothetical protein
LSLNSFRLIGSSPSVSRCHVGPAAACTDGPATHRLRIPDPTQEGVFTTLSKGQAEAMRALPWGDRSTHGPPFTVAPPGSRYRPSRRPAPTLEVAVTPGPYRRHHHRCTTDRPPPLALPAHGHPPGTPGHPPAVAPAGPLHLSPSSGPWRQTRGRDSYPPGINMPRAEIFSKNHSRKNIPRVMGPEHKNFKTIFGRGITHLGRLTDTP